MSVGSLWSLAKPGGDFIVFFLIIIPQAIITALFNIVLFSSLFQISLPQDFTTYCKNISYQLLISHYFAFQL